MEGESLDRSGPMLLGADVRDLADPDGAGLVVLDRVECLRRLARGGVGRIAINVGALPRIELVRFAFDADRVVLCVGAGTTLERATRDAVVAFEAGGTEPDSDSEWSVSLVGVAHHLPDGADSARAEALQLPRSWLDRPHGFVSISTEHVSGRSTPASP